MTKKELQIFVVGTQVMALLATVVLIIWNIWVAIPFFMWAMLAGLIVHAFVPNDKVEGPK